jgi:hypothetical protein
MIRFNDLCDDYYVNMTLSTEMELPTNRETVLHFFERVQKTYPTMHNFHCRERGDFVLEEDKDQGDQRWVTIESRRICSGMVNPESLDPAMDQHNLILELAPYMLSISPLDCEALDLHFGFDFTYRGNHNQLIYEALGLSVPFEPIANHPGSRIVTYEPSITIALDQDCRNQVRLGLETRTNAYQIRTGEFAEDQMSVYLTARRFGSLGSNDSFLPVLRDLYETCMDMLQNHVVDNILQPLKQTIVLKG